MGVQVTVEHRSISFRHADGKYYNVDVLETGDLRLSAAYRGEVISGKDVEAIRQKMEVLDADARVKRDRAKALKDAAANPIPALSLVYENPRGRAVDQGQVVFKRVYVRGVDQRLKSLLLTWPDGTKDKSGRRWGGSAHTVLRALDEAEKDEIRAARQAVLDNPPPLSAVDYNDVNRSVDINVVGRYTNEGTWEAEYGGKTYSVTQDEVRGYYPSSILADKIIHDIILAKYPFAVDRWNRDGGVVETASINRLTSASLFTSREEAEAYIDAQTRAEVASSAYSKVVASYRFDASIFTDKDVTEGE